MTDYLFTSSNNPPEISMKDYPQIYVSQQSIFDAKSKMATDSVRNDRWLSKLNESKRRTRMQKP